MQKLELKIVRFYQNTNPVGGLVAGSNGNKAYISPVLRYRLPKITNKLKSWIENSICIEIFAKYVLIEILNNKNVNLTLNETEK